MSTYYLLPANLHQGTVQGLPTDVKHKIQQNQSGVEAAEKVQNLNTHLKDGSTDVDATIKTTVASVLAPWIDTEAYPEPTTSNIPAYRIHVSGWTNSQHIPEGTLTVVGGFPRSFTSGQDVDPSKQPSILPHGTLTSYATTLLGDAVTPQVTILTDTDVILADIPNTNFPSWTVTLPDVYSPDESQVIQFDFSFYLYIM